MGCGEVPSGPWQLRHVPELTNRAWSASAGSSGGCRPRTTSKITRAARVTSAKIETI